MSHRGFERTYSAGLLYVRFWPVSDILTDRTQAQIPGGFNLYRVLRVRIGR